MDCHPYHHLFDAQVVLDLASKTPLKLEPIFFGHIPMITAKNALGLDAWSFFFFWSHPWN